MRRGTCQIICKPQHIQLDVLYLANTQILTLDKWLWGPKTSNCGHKPKLWLKLLLCITRTSHVINLTNITNLPSRGGLLATTTSCTSTHHHHYLPLRPHFCGARKEKHLPCYSLSALCTPHCLFRLTLHLRTDFFFLHWSSGCILRLQRGTSFASVSFLLTINGAC